MLCGIDSDIYVYVYSKYNLYTLQLSYEQTFFPDFRSGKAPILVATDVAARGLGTYNFQ